MAWMKDTYHTLFAQDDINAAGVCTGKPVLIGGIGNNLLIFYLKIFIVNKYIFKI